MKPYRMWFCKFRRVWCISPQHAKDKPGVRRSPIVMSDRTDRAMDTLRKRVMHHAQAH